MGTIVISTNLSLDGIIEDPDGLDGSRLGGWFTRFGGQDLEPWTRLETEETLNADALLVGRRSDEWFAARWNGRSGTWADKLNTMPKYVVSSTTEAPQWRHATLINGDVPAEITKLKQRVPGEILVYASYQLARTLFDHDLVDELRLVVFPVLLGSGRRMFGELADLTALRLVSSEKLGDGLAFLTYRVARPGSPTPSTAPGRG